MSAWVGIGLIMDLAVCLLAWRLARIDLKTRRLPDRYVGVLLLIVLGRVLLLVVEQSDPAVLARALWGGLSLSGFYGIIRLSSNGGVGLGDVKLAVPLGIWTAAQGWKTLITGFAITSLLGGVFAAVILLRRAPQKAIAYGPFMICGALVAYLLSS